MSFEFWNRIIEINEELRSSLTVYRRDSLNLELRKLRLRLVQKWWNGAVEAEKP